MIGILIAILVAALVYWLCLALGLPAIVGIVAAILVLVGGVGSGGYGMRAGRRALARRPRAARPTTQASGARLCTRSCVRACKSFRAHQMTDRAAALTYYAMMSLFPALLVGVTLLGLFGQQALVTDAADYLARPRRRQRHGQGASRKVADRTWSTPRAARSASRSSISVLLALNGASGAFGAAGRALNLVLRRRGGPRHSCAASSPTSPRRSS